MAKLSKEEYIQRFNSLPENIQDALFSIETVDKIRKVGSENNLAEDAILKLTDLVGDLLMGFINRDDFQKLIATEINTKPETAQKIAQELIDTILAPLDASATKETTPIRPVFAPPPIIPQKQQEPPILKTKEESKSLPQAPLILHQEEELEPHKEFVSPAPQRPLFYKPTFKGVDQISQIQPTARLELGEETKIAQSRTERTPSQPSRIVHYSEFRTLLNPSDNNQPPSRKEQPEQLPPKEKIEAEEKPAVHPNNVVDLKDLPLE